MSVAVGKRNVGLDVSSKGAVMRVEGFLVALPLGMVCVSKSGRFGFALVGEGNWFSTDGAVDGTA